MRASAGPSHEWGSGGRGVRATGGARSRILVVEDDADFRDLLMDHLTSSGRVVRGAANGAEALAALGEERSDIGLVLLDLRMPVMDGFELVRRLDAAPRLRVPIVVMTAEHETRLVERHPLVLTVLFKPLDLRRLDALIEASVRA